MSESVVTWKWKLLNLNFFVVLCLKGDFGLKEIRRQYLLLFGRQTIMYTFQYYKHCDISM